jgi:Co/Zn/Cd efflux system component
MTMSLFGLWVVGTTAWHVVYGVVPEPLVMGVIGTLALVANAAVALMLYRFRTGDSNMRSVWICSRNDVVGNLAVLFAALGVFGTGTIWPDIVVAAAMAGLALQGSLTVVRHALADLRLVSA